MSDLPAPVRDAPAVEIFQLVDGCAAALRDGDLSWRVCRTSITGFAEVLTKRPFRHPISRRRTFSRQAYVVARRRIAATQQAP